MSESQRIPSSRRSRSVHVGVPSDLSESSFLGMVKFLPGFLRARALALLLKFLKLSTSILCLQRLVLERRIVRDPLRKMDQSFVVVLQSILIYLETEVSNSILPACLRTNLTSLISFKVQRTRALNPGFLLKTSKGWSRVRGRTSRSSSSLIRTCQRPYSLLSLGSQSKLG
jgi:hypothetical protein